MLVSVTEEVVRMLRSSSVVDSTMSSIDPNDDVLMTSAPLDGRNSSSESNEVSTTAASSSSSSSSALSSQMEADPTSLDSSMIVSVLVMRDILDSMTELPKNLRTSKAALSSGMPEVSSTELDLLAGCVGLLDGIEFLIEDENCDDLLEDCMVVVKVVALDVLVRLLMLLDVLNDSTEFLFRTLTPTDGEDVSFDFSNLLTSSSKLASNRSGDAAALRWTAMGR